MENLPYGQIMHKIDEVPIISAGVPFKAVPIKIIIPSKIEMFIDVVHHFRLNYILYCQHANDVIPQKKSKISLFINKFMKPNKRLPYIMSYLDNTNINVYKLGDYLKQLINIADLGDANLFNKLSKSFHKLDFENKGIWYSILHMISAIVISVNPSCAIYNKILDLLKINCPDKISTILNTPFSIGESKNIRIIQIITQFIDVNGEYIDGLDIPINPNDDEETIAKKRNSKINESLSTRVVMFKTLIYHGANIYNTVLYSTYSGIMQCNLSPIESLIINIHALLTRQAKYPSQIVNFAKAINFSHHIILYLIMKGYDITDMIAHISPEIKRILYSEKFIALFINFMIDNNIVEPVINIALKEHYFLVSLLVAYINEDITHSVLTLILYHQNIKIEHFLYKNDNHIVLELLINAEVIAIANKITNFKIINSFVEILNKNADLMVHFYEYPLLLNWLLEIQYLPIVEYLLPKRLFLRDDILTVIFERALIFCDNFKQLYCFNVIKSLLPYVELRHFNGVKNIISLLMPHKGKNLNYSGLYKKVINRKKELVAPVITTARLLDKTNKELEGRNEETDFIEEIPKKAKKKSSKKKSKKATMAVAATVENADANTDANTDTNTDAASPVTTVIKAVDAMLELSKLATDEEASKIYDSVTTLCQLAIGRHTTVMAVATTATAVATTASTVATTATAVATMATTEATTAAKVENMAATAVENTATKDSSKNKQLHQKKIAKRREKLITFDCILAELYRIVTGVILNYFDKGIRFIILYKNTTDFEFCLILENNNYTYIEYLIDGFEELFKNVHRVSPSMLNMETYSTLSIHLTLCNAHSKLFDDNSILVSTRNVDSTLLINYLNTQEILNYKKLFIDEVSMFATFCILSEYKSILYNIDNIVSKILLDSIRYDIVLYGSYGFGAELITSDIDICILTEYENYNYISHLIDAFSDIFDDIKYIPASVKSPNLIIMNTKNGIHIDLAFSNLRPTVFNMANNNIVSYLHNKYIELSQIDYGYLFADNASIYASYALLLGYHIVNIVPDLKIYSDALIQIKINAIENKIYGSNFGYLNGSTLAIMLLYVTICGELDGNHTLVQSFYQIFSDWDWTIYGIVIDSKQLPLKLSKYQIQELDSSMRCYDFDMFVGTYGACSSCTIWADTLNRIQAIFKLNSLMISLPSNYNISRLQMNGTFSQRGLAKKIKQITRAFRENIHWGETSPLLIYPEPSVDQLGCACIVICVNIPHLFDRHYNKFLAIANGAMH